MSQKFEGWRVVAVSKGQVALEPWHADAPAGGEVLVQNIVSLISPGTELSRVYDTHRARRGFPCAIGYLSVGRIAAVGKGVARWRVGDQVVASMGHLSYMKFSSGDARLLPVPQGVRLEHAVFAGLAAISYRGVLAGRLQRGGKALVFGQGLVGLLATYFCKYLGASRVVAVERLPMRMELARLMGADEVLSPADDLLEKVRAVLDGGADVVIDATGTPHVISATFEYAADNGRIVVLGGVHKDVTLDLYTHFQKRNLTLVGAGYAHPAAGTGTEQANRMLCLRLIAEGRLPVERLITHIVPVQQAPEMYRALAEHPDETLGVVLKWPD